MSKIIKKIISIIMTFVLLLNFAFFNQKAFANGNGKITVIINSKEVQQDIVKNIVLKVWKLTSEEKTKSKEEIIKSLNGLSESELNEKFGNPILTEPTDENGITTIDNISDDIYYVREHYDKIKKYQVVPFVFETPYNGQNRYTINAKLIEKPLISDEVKGKVKLIKKSKEGKVLQNVGFKLISRTVNGDVFVPISNNSFDEKGNVKTLYTDKNGEIYLENLPKGEYIFREVEALAGYKVDYTDTFFKIENNELVILNILNEKQNTGEKSFVKISKDKTPKFLEGAVFKVTVKKGDKFIPIIVDGREYEVVSGKDGKFKVENLEFGKYYLWEVKAPKGYKALSGSIEFDVDENSASNEIMVIKNELFEKGYLPKTGDILLIVLVIGGLTMFIAGYLISRDKKEV